MALTGLFELDPPVFSPLAARFADDTDPVHVHISGCIGATPVPMNEVVSRDGAMQLTKEVDSVARFFEAYPERARVFDIAGGSYPSLFFDVPEGQP